MCGTWQQIVFAAFIFISPSLADRDFQSHPLDFSTHPCDSLFQHVCAKTSDDDYDVQFKQKFANALLDDAIDHIELMDDPVFDLIVAILKNKGHRNAQKCASMGLEGMNTLGKALAYGRMREFAIVCTRSQNKCEFLLRKPSPHETGQTVTRKLDRVDDLVVKAAIIDYLYLVDPEDRMKRATLNVRFPMVQNWKAYDFKLQHRMTQFEREDPSVKGFKKDLHEILFWNPDFSPYFNLAYSKWLKGRDVYLSKEQLKQVEDLFYAIKNEIVENVKKSIVVTVRSRTKIITYLNNLKPHVGLPEGFHNSTEVDRQIKRYQKQLRNFKVHGDCRLETLAREVQLIRNQIVLHNDGQTLNTLSRSQNYEDSVHVHNAFLYRDVYLLPAYIHIYKMKISPGTKYGILAATIGHEIFHGLGLQTHKNHLMEVGETEPYKKAVECYTKYYDSMCVWSKPFDCPAGKLKRDEGFADIEGARVAFSLLKKELAKSGRHNRAVSLSDVRSSSGYNELQWFFIMMMLEDCSTITDHRQFEHALADPHPRPSIRRIAIAMQMNEFTEAFGCKPHHDMYVEDLCEAFPSNDSKRLPPKTAINSAQNRMAGRAGLTLEVIKNNHQSISCISAVLFIVSLCLFLN